MADYTRQNDAAEEPTEPVARADAPVAKTRRTRTADCHRGTEQSVGPHALGSPPPASELLEQCLDGLRTSGGEQLLAAAREAELACRAGRILPDEVLPALRLAYRRERSVTSAAELLAIINRVKEIEIAGICVPGSDRGAVGNPDSDAYTAAVIVNELRPRYCVEDRIAATRMSEVYRAWRRSDGRTVAIKCVPYRMADPVAKEAFHRETQLLVQLRHPNIVAVFERGLVRDMPYVVMEFIECGSLRDLVAGPRPLVHRVVRIGIGVCEALGHAHANGVYHLDVKPGNILLGPQDEPKLADFGIARVAGASVNAAAGVTPKYAAPEQLQAEGRPDRRSDIYSLGVVLHQLLTGHLPQGSGEQLRSRDGSIPASLASVLGRALEPRPADRFDTADEFGAALRECASR